MRIVRLGPLFASALLSFVPVVRAQQVSAPAPRDPQSVNLLQRSFAALVGTTTVKDVTMTGSVRRIAGSDDESGTATLKATSLGQARIDLSVASGSRGEIADISQGSPVGSWCGPDTVWHSTVPHNLLTDPSWFFPVFLFNRVLSTPTYAVSALDAETKDGVAVEHFAVYIQASNADPTPSVTQNLSRMDVYLDSSTLLPVAISFNIHPDDNALTDIPVEIRLSNYQKTQGILTAYHIQKYVQNSLALDITVSSTQINSGLSGSDFQAQ
jgi:hypothetical protein